MPETKPKVPRTMDPDVRRITELARTVKQLAAKIRAVQAAHAKLDRRTSKLDMEYKRQLDTVPDPMRDYLHTTVGLGKDGNTEAET